MSTKELAHTIIETLEEKKGENILLLDISEISSIADYFIICSGTSDRLLNALANAVIENAKIHWDTKGLLEGVGENGWVVIDLKDIVVHLFSPEKRNYYKLEDLWREGKTLVHLQ